MPGNSISTQGQLKVLTITDWNSGIVNQNYAYEFYAAVPNAVVPATSDRITSSGNTYGVMGLPAGGLLLGPTVYQYQTTTSASQPTTTLNSVNVVGVVNRPTLGVSYIIVSGNQSAGAHPQSWCVYQFSTLSGVPFTDGILLTQYNTAGGVGLNTAAPAFPFISTLANNVNYQELLIWTLNGWTTTAGNIGSGVAYWNLSAASAGTLTTATAGVATPANGRVWLLGQANYTLPSNESFLNNQVSYTGPTTSSTANNLSIGSQATMVDYDDPAFFGAWGQITSNEMLLVKSNQGGVVISGDIFNPSVYKAPAVPGTNGMAGNAVITAQGLVYQSFSNGIWAWQGGASATKLSAEVSDAMFQRKLTSATVNAPNGPFYNYCYNIQQINNCLFTSAGMFYNLDTGAWWSLPPYLANASTQYPFQFMTSIPQLTTGGSQYGFAAIGANMTGVTTLQFDTTQYAFDVSVLGIANGPPAGVYNSFWESNPIILSPNFIEIQNITITMQGHGTLTVTVKEVGGTPLHTAPSISTNNTSFQQISLNTAFQTQAFVLQIAFVHAAIGNATPIIHSIQVSYRDNIPLPKGN